MVAVTHSVLNIHQVRFDMHIDFQFFLFLKPIQMVFQNQKWYDTWVNGDGKAASYYLIFFKKKKWFFISLPCTLIWNRRKGVNWNEFIYFQCNCVYGFSFQIFKNVDFCSLLTIQFNSIQLYSYFICEHLETVFKTDDFCFFFMFICERSYDCGSYVCAFHIKWIPFELNADQF